MTSAYAPTAYDSSRARTLPPVSAAERPTSALLETQGIHCGELLVMSSDDCIELLNSTKPEDLAELEEPAHESVFWGTHFSVHNVLLIVTYFFALLSACSVVAGILPLLALQFKKAILGGGGAFLVCYLIYRLGKYLLTTRWFEQVYKIRLSRKTGMVGRLIKGEWVDHPFDEYLACSATRSHYNLSISYRLALFHRYSKLRVDSADNYHPWEVQQEWEFWQQYMDVSQPLPDVPQFEACRRHDPVTAAHDEKWGRPRDFWKHVDVKAYRMMFEAARQSARSYPWGLSREQALAQGWQSSGFDQEALRQIWYKAVADGCRFAVQDKKLLLVPPEEYAREHNVGPGVLLG